MAYNNGFPIGYQPAQIYYPQAIQQVQQAPAGYMQQQPQPQAQLMTPPTIHAEIVQVDSEQAAENYPLAVGASQMMIAKDETAIYVKSMYANGQYNLDVFTKRPRTPKRPEIDMDIYITREEFENRLQAILEASEGKEKTAPVVAKKSKKEGEE